MVGTVKVDVFDVRFLESVGPDQRDCHLAGDATHRDAVQSRIRNRSQKIRDGRSSGRNVFPSRKDWGKIRVAFFPMDKPRPRHSILILFRIAVAALWISVMLVGTYVFVFHRHAAQSELHHVMSVSWWMAWSVYLVLTVIRGLIFMPAAPLILLGTAFLPPVPLFLLTLVGISGSTSVTYWFPTALHLEDFFRKTHKKSLARLQDLLGGRTLAVIAGWSFLPMTPTLLIIYACAVLRVDFKKVLLGVAMGSGANCAIYIFVGDYLLRLAGLKF